MKQDAKFGTTLGILSCVMVVVTVAATFLIRRHFKAKKLTNKSQSLIELKDCPPFKSVEIHQQLDGPSWLSQEEGSSDVARDFSHLREIRTGIGDPLLDVLHTNQLTKERLYNNKLCYQTVERDSETPPGSCTHSSNKQQQGVLWEDGISAELALVWASIDKSLSIVLVNLENLRSASAPLDLFVSIRLKEGKKDPPKGLTLQQGGTPRKRVYGPKESMTFSFRGLTLEDAHRCFLILDLSEKKTRLSKEEVVARGSLSLSKLILVPNTPQPAYVHLNFLENGSGSHLTESGFGSLLIGIKCCFVGQISAKFLVTAKRAEKLPLSKFGGEYTKVELFVLRNGERLHCFTSCLKGGSNPEWNSSFTFDISRNNIFDYSLEFVIMRIGRLNGASKMAKTTLCQSFGSSNILYWEDAIENLGQESIWRRNLKSPRFGDVRSGIKENTMGLLLVSLEESIYSKKKGLTEFEVTVKTLAHLEYGKSGGDYKVEVLVHGTDKPNDAFTSHAAPSTSITWNACFTFFLPKYNSSNCRLDLTLIRIGRMRKSIRIGIGHLGSEDCREMAATCGRSGQKWIQIQKI